MIIDRSTEFKYLIEPLKLEDPRLHQALDLMIDQMSSVTLEVSPILPAAPTPVEAPALVNPPTILTAKIFPTAIRLTWDVVPNASQYEVRLLTTNWDSAEFVIRTNSTVVDVVPFYGIRGTYAVKSMDSSGNYSENFISVDVDIIPPRQVAITGSVIVNNVLLSWTQIGDFIPDSGYLQVDKYEIQRDGVKIGETKASYISSFEKVGGTFTYSVIAIDIAGNRGVPASVVLIVENPPNYVLKDERTSDLSGEKNNVIIYQTNKLLGPVFVPAQTWEQHFVSRTWVDPEDQVTAGFPIYIQPSPAVLGGDYGDARGYYFESFDYGEVFDNVVANVQYNFNQLNPLKPVTFALIIGYSTDAVNWTLILSGGNELIPTMRFMYIHLLFYGDPEALAEVFNIRITLNELE